jgi:hypothetical protein
MLAAIEVNLLLWIVVLGNGMAHGGDPLTSATMTVDGRLLLGGFLLAAILQHVAYYGFRRARATTATV